MRHPAIAPILFLLAVVAITSGSIVAYTYCSKPSPKAAVYKTIEVNGPNNTKELRQQRARTEADVSEDRKSAERAMKASGRL